VTAPPGTVWITGLPAAGKTTLALELGGLLREEGTAVDVIDGDVLRQGESRALGFSPADRATQAHRAAARAAAHAAAGGVAVVALVSPYAHDRDAARREHEGRGLHFVEVWMATPLAECEARDPKGLYARARVGELEGLTGVDAPYEAPVAAEVVIAPDRPPHDSARAVAAVLASGTL
jgi:bifunctional enzyme CysN/CysC